MQSISMETRSFALEIAIVEAARAEQMIAEALQIEPTLTMAEEKETRPSSYLSTKFQIQKRVRTPTNSCLTA